LLSSEICKYTHFVHSFFTFNLAVKKNCGWWIKTAFIFEFIVKSSIRNRYFPPCAKKKKKVKFFCPVKYVNIQIFSHLTWLSQKNRGWLSKTTYILEFSVKSTIWIKFFSSWDKKNLNFVDQCYRREDVRSVWIPLKRIMFMCSVLRFIHLL
jgi:hypothetical protein